MCGFKRIDSAFTTTSRWKTTRKYLIERYKCDSMPKKIWANRCWIWKQNAARYTISWKHYFIFYGAFITHFSKNKSHIITFWSNFAKAQKSNKKNCKALLFYLDKQRDSPNANSTVPQTYIWRFEKNPQTINYLFSFIL